MSQLLPFDKLTDIEIIAIEQAADGLVSDTLSEWPYLFDALNKLGLPAHGSIPARRIGNMCKLIVKVWTRNSIG